MRYSILSSALLAAALVCSPLALATPSAQDAATKTESSSSSSHQQQHHKRSHKRSHQHSHKHMRKARMHHTGRNGQDHRLLRKLDLSDAQRSAIHELVTTQRKQARSGSKDLWQKRQALRDATPGSHAWTTAVNALAKAQGEAASGRVLAQAKLRSDIYQQLTPAQREQMAQLHSERQERMQKWRKSRQQRKAGNTAATQAAK